jgi:antitoxin component YwqK of YwqJK toxin-antitoxin module
MASETHTGEGMKRWSRWTVVAGCTVVLGAAALFVAFKKGTPVPEKEWPVVRTMEVERKGGLLVRKGTTEAFNGWLTDAYASGVLRSRSFVSNGILHGLSEGWHTNGAPQVRESFVNGRSEGTVTKWSIDGSLHSVATTQAGVLEGRFQRWHTNGTLAEEMEMRRGEPHGTARSWYPSGNPKAEVVLDAGQVVSRRYWDDATGEQAAVVAAPGGGQP